jgi:predicted nucleotidyltransferase
MAAKTNVLAPPETFAERKRAIGILRAHETDLRALGVGRLWLFGSIARGDAGPRSDVDVMIAVPAGRKFSLFDLGEVRVELCELLDREVDVVIEEGLRPDFRNDIASDLVDVF